MNCAPPMRRLSRAVTSNPCPAAPKVRLWRSCIRPVSATAQTSSTPARAGASTAKPLPATWAKACAAITPDGPPDSSSRSPIWPPAPICQPPGSAAQPPVHTSASCPPTVRNDSRPGAESTCPAAIPCWSISASPSPVACSSSARIPPPARVAVNTCTTPSTTRRQISLTPASICPAAPRKVPRTPKPMTPHLHTVHTRVQDRQSGFSAP